MIRKVDIDKGLNNKDEKCIVIVATGWANGGSFISPNKKYHVQKFKNNVIHFFCRLFLIVLIQILLKLKNL